MSIIKLTTVIHASIEVCFNASRNIDLHIESTKHTGETAIAGKTSGLIELGESVTWRAKHLGIWQTLSTKITAYSYPDYFVDEMISGAFKSMKHEHTFYTKDNTTVMEDVFNFESPAGIIGKLFNKLFLENYMKKLLVVRNEVIKKYAEEITD